MAARTCIARPDPAPRSWDDEIPAGLPVQAVLWLLARHPWRYVGRRWNYKSAVTSSGFRAGLFFATNISAGLSAATAALATEFWLRFITAGGYGALTQAFRRAEPERRAVLTALVVVPAVGHAVELAVHWARGTPNLQVSIGASIVFTLISTSFNLFAMRRGVFTTGAGSRTLVDDLRQMPALVVSFTMAIVRGLGRA